MVNKTPLALPLPDGQVVDVHLSHKARTRISLNISAQGEVRLSIPPKVTERDALAFLQTHRGWLMQHLQKHTDIVKAAALPLDEISYLGERLPLERLAGQRQTARLQGGVLQVHGADEEAQLRQTVGHWLYRQAAIILPGRAGELAEQFGARPAKVALSSAGRRWGSCTVQGNIRINWRLIQSPPAVIDYVIAHELAHLWHMNHSPAFWAQVEQWCADWHQHRRWLRAHGEQLFALG